MLIARPFPELLIVINNNDIKSTLTWPQIALERIEFMVMFSSFFLLLHNRTARFIFQTQLKSLRGARAPESFMPV